MPRPPTPTPQAATQPAPKPPERPTKAASADTAAPTPPVAAAPSKGPARVRRRARIEIPPTPTTAITPAPTPASAKPSGLLVKTDQKGKAKASLAQKPAKAPKPKAGKPKANRGLSALNAAAKVLEGLKGTEAREGIQANDLIDRMQRASLWTSPGGKTPAATLYAAMIREIKVKKGEARFVRTSPGHFAFKAAGKARRSGAAE